VISHHSLNNHRHRSSNPTKALQHLTHCVDVRRKSDTFSRGLFRQKPHHSYRESAFEQDIRFRVEKNFAKSSDGSFVSIQSDDGTAMEQGRLVQSSFPDTEI
jgi:hypothetical protein